jgi:hypothetical protein
MAISAADLEHAIKGIDFPASKDELVKQANNNNADNSIVQVIQKLPKQKFKSPIEVSKAFGKEKR